MQPDKRVCRAIALSSIMLVPAFLVLAALQNEEGGRGFNTLITIQTSAVPSSTQPVNQSVLVNQSNVVITWTITDPENSSGIYLVGYDDYNPIVDEDYFTLLTMTFPVWTNNTPFSVDVNTAQPGWHNYTIFFSDMTKTQIMEALLGGQSISGDYSTAWVKIESPPSIQSPGHLKVHRGSVSNWNFTIVDQDTSQGLMNVTVDGIPALSPNTQWNASQPVSILIDTVADGTFNHSISATDGNYTTRFSCLVSVSENFPPEIIGLENRTVSFDEPIVEISFKITDFENATGNYTVLLHGIPINASLDGATWINDTVIRFGYELPVPGPHPFSVIADDLEANRTITTFIIRANAAPSVSSPPGATYHLRQSGAVASWDVSDPDDANGTYTVHRAGMGAIQPIQVGTWTNGSAITVNVDTQSPGTWTYTITLSDGYSTRQATTTITILASVLDEQGATIVLAVFVLTGFVGMGLILAIKNKKI